jgi:hypothetical protein
MASCHEMKKGEIYVCEDCGLELKVVRECHSVGKPVADCDCHDDGSECAITCCGRELVKKGV